MNTGWKWYWIWGICLAGITAGCAGEEAADLSPAPYMRGDQEWVNERIAAMSLEEKIGQLFLWKGTPATPAGQEKLLEYVAKGQVGGVLLQGLAVNTYLSVTDSCRVRAPLPLFFAGEEAVLFNAQFADAEPAPDLMSALATADDSLLQQLSVLYLRQAQALGINMAMSVDLAAHDPAVRQFFNNRLPALTDQRILTVANHFTDFYPNHPDTSRQVAGLLHPARQATLLGIGGFAIDPQVMLPVSLSLQGLYLADYFRRRLSYDGLLITELGRGDSPEYLLAAGVNLMIIESDPAPFIQQIRLMVRNGVIHPGYLDQSVRKVLLAKAWMREGLTDSEPVPTIRVRPIQAALPTGDPGLRREPQEVFAADRIWDHFHDPQWRHWREEVGRRSGVLLQNPEGLLPLPAMGKRPVTAVAYGTHRLAGLQGQLEKYTAVNWQRGRWSADGEMLPFEPGAGPVIVVLDDMIPSRARDLAWLQQMSNLALERPLTVINFGDPVALEYLPERCALIQFYERNEATETAAAQIAFGGLAPDGKLPSRSGVRFASGAGLTLQPTRLGYLPPEAVGIAAEKLTGIDAIFNSAIRMKATPGGQVLVAKDGKVIYSKSFGHHTYSKKQRVEDGDVYDLASITKVVATTLAAMQAYEEEKISLRTRLKKYLTEYQGTELANIRVNDLLTHQSGIQPHLPVIPYLKYRDRTNTNCDSFFCVQGNEPFTIQVADAFYFDQHYLDTIRQALGTVMVRRGVRYRYSDVNFVLLQFLLERQLEVPLDQWAAREIYSPLGLRNTGYLPMRWKPYAQIVPTEKDDRWRHQQIQGFVHDETAALFGGVAGHAGVFSNAEDLAVILQMLLNGGSYGGRQFFQPETVELFSRSIHGNHRGLGFDKAWSGNQSAHAASMSASAYGHTGFTGPCVWVDPEQDLVFVFLANRVYPSARNRTLFRKNVRARIHQVVYDALGSYERRWPVI